MSGAAAPDFLIVHVSGQAFALPAAQVAEVVRPHPVHPVPGAPAGIAGLINLRGRILCVVDLRRCLELPDDRDAPGRGGANVIVGAGGTLYSLEVDAVSGMRALPENLRAPLPPTVPPAWRGKAAGLCRLPETLVTVLDAETLLGGFAGAGERRDMR